MTDYRCCWLSPGLPQFWVSAVRQPIVSPLLANYQCAGLADAFTSSPPSFSTLLPRKRPTGSGARLSNRNYAVVILRCEPTSSRRLISQVPLIVGLDVSPMLQHVVKRSAWDTLSTTLTQACQETRWPRMRNHHVRSALGELSRSRDETRRMVPSAIHFRLTSAFGPMVRVTGSAFPTGLSLKLDASTARSRPRSRPDHLLSEIAQRSPTTSPNGYKGGVMSGPTRLRDIGIHSSR